MTDIEKLTKERDVEVKRAREAEEALERMKMFYQKEMAEKVKKVMELEKENERLRKS